MIPIFRSFNLPVSRLRRVFYGWIVVSVGTFILFLTWGGHYSFGIFLLPLTESLEASRGAVAALISIRGIVSGALSLPFGALADRYGPRRVIIPGVVFLGMAWLLSAQSSRLWQLYLFFGVMGGVAMSAIYVPIISVVSRWFNLKRALALGIVLSSFGISQTVLPPVLSPLTARFGWQPVFALVGAVIIAGAVPAALLLRRDPEQAGLCPDGAGAAGAREEAASPVRQEKVSWTRQEALGTATFWQIFLVYFSCAFCFQIIIFHIVARAVDARVPAAAAALVVSFTGGAGIVGRLVVGAAAARFGNVRTLAVCVLVQIPAILLFAVVRDAWVFYLLAVVFGFAYGGVSPLVPATNAAFFGPKHIGAIFGVMTMGYTFGAASGPVTAGYMFDFTGSYLLIFAFSGLILTAMLVLTLFLKEPRKKAI